MQVHHLFDLGKAISIHALREEGDIPPCNPLPGWTGFLSTPSARRATRLRPWAAFVQKFLSTPSARRATESGLCDGFYAIFLSTPSARRATKPCSFWRRTRQNFYPRPPRGGRQRCPLPSPEPSDFYPRPPRGGRPTRPRAFSSTSDFYPRPPRGGRPKTQRQIWTQQPFLSTPSARRATAMPRVKCHLPLFLSTPSARRATHDAGDGAVHVFISIHALREEGDRDIVLLLYVRFYFYPRPPRGGRLC